MCNTSKIEGHSGPRKSAEGLAEGCLCHKDSNTCKDKERPHLLPLAGSSSSCGYHAKGALHRIIDGLVWNVT